MITLICADALIWLAENKSAGSIITSLPDAEEIGMQLPQWREWFTNAAASCMLSASPECPAIFYQTDRKAGGVVHSKAELLFSAAHRAGLRLIWHKIVLRRDVGKVDIHRPGFTHLMAFSVSCPPGAATPDAIYRGDMSYPNAMGYNAAKTAVEFAAKLGKPVCDPFCGRGTIPIMANRYGLDATGVDIDPAQISAAEKSCAELQIP